LLGFVRKVIAVYHEEPTLQRRRFFHGKSLHGDKSPEIAWLDPTGKEMSQGAWQQGHVRCLGVHLMGGLIDVDEYGEPIIGRHMLILFNADHQQEIPFALPKIEGITPWERLFDTSTGFVDSAAAEEPGEDVSAAGAYKLAPCSMAVFRSEIQEPVENPAPSLVQ
jgi:glycogen operon protein